MRIFLIKFLQLKGQEVSMNLFLILLYPVIALSIVYETALIGKEILNPCEEYPDVFVDKYLDLSNLQFITQEDGSVYCKGWLKIIGDLPAKEPIRVNIEVYKKKRGSWMPTIYSLRRPDLCTTLFNPTEFWYKYAKDIKEEYRKCPLVKGTEFHYDLNTDLKVDIPDRQLEGEYKAEITLRFGSNKTVALCMAFYADIYRI